MLIEKYGPVCAKLFLITIAFRLLNEVWSNTKVMSLYFGAEGSASYWTAAVAITLFTLSYAWSGGMRASLLTDRLQTILVLDCSQWSSQSCFRISKHGACLRWMMRRGMPG
jgi:SSS family solute:Na+ symporter